MLRRTTYLTRAALRASLFACTLSGPAAAVAPCDRHACSDDVNSVWGDEKISWNPLLNWGTDPGLRCYEIRELGTGTICARRCESTDGWSRWGPTTWFEPQDFTTTPCFPRQGLTYEYSVRACAGSTCGNWSANYVELIGGQTACFGNFGNPPRRCEKPCHAGAPKRFPSIPACVPPGVTGLRVGKGEVHWTEVPDTTLYELVRGDVGRLVRRGGDLGWSTQDCVVGIPTTSFPYDREPEKGEAFWFLVRAVNPYGAGSWYADGGPGADEAIDASMRGCFEAAPPSELAPEDTTHP